MDAPVVIECFNSFGRVSFRFLTGTEEWTITMKQKDSLENNIVDKIERYDVVKDYGCIITLTKPIGISSGESIRTFEWHSTVSRDDSREIWGELNERGFKPTQKTQKLINQGR